MTDHQAIAVDVSNVKKRFGKFTALEAVDLQIRDNEFFTLLGPSGCGKTTLLRMIAGFEATSEGAIYLYGDEIELLPPHNRPVNTVFQSYALFPHMTVKENIGFGLRMLGWSAVEQASRVSDMVRMVRLQEFVHRRPQQLSGGQQQRVALARAMAPRPKVLLLDEPLSALDLKLRQQMRAELKEIQQQTGITFVFVTHDQEEALSMSDRIAVMSAGSIQQIGTPTEVYEAPKNQFVANFIGETNLLEAVVKHVDNNVASVEIEGVAGLLTVTISESASVGQTGVVSFRPERLQIMTPSMSSSSAPTPAKVVLSGKPASRPTTAILNGTLRSSVYLGTDYQYAVELENKQLISVRLQNVPQSVMGIKAGDSLTIGLDDTDARFLVD